MHTLLLVIVSITLNIIIAILGVVPSFFITSFNIIYFGIFGGFIVSLIGESLGAVVSFYLYRLGFKKVSQNMLEKHEKVNKIVNSPTKEQMKLIVSLRIVPYVPSGLITYAASISNISIIPFVISSTLGKIPAMVIEILLAAGVIKYAEGQNITTVIGIASIIFFGAILIKILKKDN